MLCALLAPLHLKTHFVHQIPNDVPLLIKCSAKIRKMSVRLSDKQILAARSIVKKITKDNQSDMLMPFGVKKQKSTLAAYCIAKIFLHKKNNVCSTIVYYS